MPMMYPNNFREGINKAYRDELQAARMYTQMADSAPNAIIALRLQYIARDEEYHSTILLGILASPSQQQAIPESLKQKDFMQMVMDAYHDEVHAAMMYLHLSLMTPDLAVAIRLRDIARDEMVHAEFFATLMASRGVQPPVI